MPLDYLKSYRLGKSIMNENKESKQRSPNERIRDALDNKELPTIYFNGFVSSTGTGDVLIVLERHNQPVAVLSTSFTVAKTLAQKLSGLIINLENITGNTIMTTENIAKKLQEEINEEIDG